MLARRVYKDRQWICRGSWPILTTHSVSINKGMARVREEPYELHGSMQPWQECMGWDAELCTMQSIFHTMSCWQSTEGYHKCICPIALCKSVISVPSYVPQPQHSVNLYYLCIAVHPLLTAPCPTEWLCWSVKDFPPWQPPSTPPYSPNWHLQMHHQLFYGTLGRQIDGMYIHSETYVHDGCRITIY